MKLFSAVLMMCGLANATTISTVSCFATPEMLSDQNSCVAGTPQNEEFVPSGTARASAAAVGLFGISAFAGASQGASPPIIPSATAEITRSEFIVTDGPSRPGFVLLEFVSQGGCNTYLNLTCGYGANFANHGISASNNGVAACSFGPCLFNAPTLLPITLGTSIEVTVRALLRAGPDASTVTTIHAFDLLDVQFQLFEEDQSTPVAWSIVAETPEPSTWLMLAAGLFIVALRASPRYPQGARRW